MRIIFLLLLSYNISAQIQQNRITYKAGLLTPVPVNVMADYQVDVSSAMVQANYHIKGSWYANVTTGYFRFRPNDCELKRFSNIPMLAGGKYKFKNDFHLGVMGGPVLFNEASVNENYWRWLYVPVFGWNKNHWGVDLMYFNWEEVPNEYNNLALCISYSF